MRRDLCFDSRANKFYEPVIIVSKHTVRQVIINNSIHDSYESIPLSDSKTYSPIHEQTTLMSWFLKCKHTSILERTARGS